MTRALGRLRTRYPRLGWQLELTALGLVVLQALCAVFHGAPSSTLAWGTVPVVVTAAALGGRWIDGWRLPLVLTLLWAQPMVYPRVGGDGVEYFVMARSLALDRDLDLTNDLACLGLSPGLRSPTGSAVVRPPVGQSLLWVPVVVGVHAALWLGSKVGLAVIPDGCSPPYQAAVCIVSFFFGFIAVVIVERLARAWYDPRVALLAALGIWLGTPLLFYMTANASMSHATAAGLGAVFVATWLHHRERPTPRAWLVLGAIGGLLFLCRVQDGVLLALPLAGRLGGRRSWRMLAAFAAGPAVAVVVQAFVWVRFFGFDFLARHTSGGTGWPGLAGVPHGIDVLFSPRHGLLTWTPLYVACLMGWLLLARKRPALMAAWVAVFTASVLINGLVGDWWAGDSFGQRRLLGLTVLFGLGLAAALDGLRRHPLVAGTAALTGMIVWNVTFMGIYNQEVLAPKDAPIPLDEVAAAQRDSLLASLESSLPVSAWTPVYDALEGVWLDSGPRSLEGVIEVGSGEQRGIVEANRGWSRIREEDGVSYRRVRDQASLRVPIREPRRMLLQLRARTEAEGRGALEIVVNGKAIGTLHPAGGLWSTVGVAVPAAALRGGTNVLLLRNTHRGRVVAVDRIELAPGASVE